MEQRPIPGTMGFSIDELGNVFDAKGNPRKTYRNGDGYVTVAVKWDDRCWWTMGVARLMGLTFLERTEEDQSEVNHRDGDLENNKHSNLEWVTPSQNNVHSEIMRKGNAYPTLYSMVDGVPKGLYRNAHEAAEDTGLTALQVWDSMKNMMPVKGISFYHRGYSDNIPKQLHRPRGLYKGMVKLASKPIKMLDILNGNILEFRSLHAAAEHFGVGKSHIHQAIVKEGMYGKVRVFQKRYQVAYIDQDFALMSREELNRALGHGAKEVIAYNFDLKQYFRFESAKAFIAEAELSKKVVAEALVKNQLKKVGDWAFLYRTNENLPKIKDFVDSPVSA